MIREESSQLNNYHGTAQQRRRTDALMPDHVKVDERKLTDLLAYAAEYAKRVRYFDQLGLQQDPVTGQDYDWSGFFDKDESVFFATLLAADIHGPDETIQTAFLHIHQYKGKERQVENFTSLIEALLDLTELLFSWYQKAKKLREWEAPHQIEREIDRAMLGELGVQFQSFGQVIGKLIPSGDFPTAANWLDRLKPLMEIWPRPDSTNLLSWPAYANSDFADRIQYAGGRLQEYYRRLYFTLSYIEEITPGLFEASIHQKNDHQPDIGLLIAFLRLFSHAQDSLNTFTSRHLDYYNLDVLGRKFKPCRPDKTVVCFEPTPLVEASLLEQGTLLLAGVNSEGIPSHYQTERELLVTQAKVAAVKTLFVSKNPLVSTNSSYRLVSAIYAAPVADSADGLGQPFTSSQQTWPVVGEDQFDLGRQDRKMVDSTLGFAIASSTLLLTEGERKVQVDLQFTSSSFTTLVGLLEDMAENAGDQAGFGDVFDSVFKQPFRLFLTGPEGWLAVEKYRILPLDDQSLSAARISLEFQLLRSAPPISAYAQDLHGPSFQSTWPVLKVLLSSEEPIYPYSFLRDLELEEVGLQVEVKGMRNLTAYNDQGLLDLSGPFVPFGPFPRRNSYLLFGNVELFNKELSEMSVDIDWAGLPEEAGGFTEYYAGYGKDITDASFKFSISALSDFAFLPHQEEDRDVFDLFTTDFACVPPLRERTSLAFNEASLKKLRFQPVYSLKALEEFTNSCRSGYFKLSLSEPKMAFGHALYPRLFAQKMAENARPRSFSLLANEEEPLTLPNEPYTPVINGLTINYSAKTTINLRKLSLSENNPNADNRIFRLHPFGTELVFAAGKLNTPYLLPRFDQDGYLFIGVDQLRPPQSLSLYFDIQDNKKKLNRGNLDINWEYLHHNEWRPFSADQIIADNTVKLSTQGIVELFCNAEITKGNGLMDPAFHWIRVSAAGNLSIAGGCKRIVSQAVEVSWVDNGDPAHLETIPEERPLISGLVKSNPGIAGVVQANTFYGGQPQESREAFYVRGSERLRHKNRAITIWDIERLVLERYPMIQQVKCIGRHGHEGLLPMGKVLVVVIPRIDGTDIHPQVGFHILSEIKHYLCSVAGAFVDISVINPVYERLKVSCRVKLRDESNHHQGRIWKELHEAITAFICPWLKSGTLGLGGSLSKTEVLAIINENPQVAFTTAFSMVQVYEERDDFYLLKDTALPQANAELLIPSRPWSVLVPVSEHQIAFMEQDEYQFAEATAIDGMQLETDFIISEEEEEGFRYTPEQDTKPKEDYFELPSDWLSG